MKYIVNRPGDTTIEVDVRLGDRLRAEREMIARGWGTPQDSPQSWLTLAIFRAALRDKLDIPDDFDDFADTIENFEQAEIDAVPFDKAPTTAP